MGDLNRIRAAFPDLDKYEYSDSEVINWMAGRLGENPQDLGVEYGVIDPEQGDLSRGFAAGVDSTKALVSGAGGIIGDTLGFEGMRDAGIRGYQRNMADIGLNSRPTDTAENVDSLGDAADFAQYYLGYAAPQIAEAALSGGIGSILGKQVVKQGVKRQVGSEVAERALRRETGQDLLQTAGRRGGLAAMGTQAVGTETGAIYGDAAQRALDEGRSLDTVDTGRAALGGLAAGALEFGADVATLGLARVGPAKGVMDLLNTRSRTANAGIRATTGAVAEGTTELLQTGVEDVGAGTALADANFSDPTSFFAGAVGGGAIGAAGGLISPAASGSDINTEQALQEAEEDAALDIQAQQEAEVEEVRAQAEAETTGRIRRTAAETFTPRKKFVADRLKVISQSLEADIRNPQTELGQAFEASINEQGIFDPADVGAEAKVFLKGYQKETKEAAEAQIAQEYVAALDSHAEAVARGEVPTPQVDPAVEGDTATDAAPQENVAAPAKKPTKKEQLRNLAVEQLGETFEVDHPELSQLLETGTGSRGAQKKSKFESMLSRIVKEEAANAQTEQAAPAAEATNSSFLDDSEVRAGLKPQQEKVYDAILKSANENTLNELFSVTFESGTTDTQLEDSSPLASEKFTQPVKESALQSKRKAQRAALEDAGVDPAVVKSVFKTKKAKPSAADEAKFSGIGGIKSQSQPIPLYQQIRVLKNANVAEDVITAFKTAVAAEPKKKAPKERGFRVEVNNDLLKSVSGITNQKSAATAASAVVSKLRSQYGEDGLREMLTRAGVTTGRGIEVADTATANDLLADGGAATATVSSAGGSQGSGASTQTSAAQKNSDTRLMKKAGMSDADIKSFYGIESTVPELSEADAADAAAIARADEEASVSAMSSILAQSWDSSASNRNAPLFDDLTMDQKIDWMHYSNAADLSNAIDRFDVLDSQQREIERAATRGTETQNEQVTEPQTEERNTDESSTSAVESESSGSSTETSPNADTGSAPPAAERQEADTGVIGEVKAAPKVEVKKRKKIVRPKTTPPKFSVGDAEAAASGTTAGNVRDAVKWLVGDTANWRTNVVNSPADLIGAVLSKELAIDGLTLSRILEKPNARGVVVTDNDGVQRAFFFADNITPGGERGAVIHELGGHLGMDNVLTREQLETSVRKIRSWAAEPPNGMGKIISERALARVAAAEEQGAVADADSELLAYFLEEAVNAGITPTSDSKSEIVSFVRQIWADFKRALRKLRPANEAALTPQDLVNMARGAARLTLATDFHGSTSAFRKVNPDYFGLGNNAVGVGFYMSEDQETGAQYMVQRMDERQAVEGALQRVDTTVAETEYLNWDQRLGDQPAMVEAFNRLPEDIRDALLEDFGSETVEALTGRQFYIGLTQLQLRDYSIESYVSDAAYEKANRHSRQTTTAMEMVSAFLDDNGVKGIKTEVKTNSTNPNPAFNKIIFNDKNTIVVGRNDAADVDTNTTTPGSIKFSVPESETNKQVAWLRKNVSPAAGEAATNLIVAAKAPYTATKNLDRVIRDNEAKLPSARKWMNLMLDAEATRNQILGLVEGVVNQTRQFNLERKEVVNRFLGDSTFYQKWGYDPEWTDAKGNKVEVKIDPILKQKYNRLTAEEQQAVRDVFSHGRELQLMMQGVAKDLGVSKFFKFDSKLEGPYAPLKRFGDYVGELKSQALLDAEAAVKEKPTAENRKKLEELKSDGDNYVISFFKSFGEAETFTEANKDKFASAVPSDKLIDFDEARPGGAQAYEKIMGAVNANMAGLDQASKDAMAKMVRDMYFQTLDQSNARLSGARRLNRAGYEKDMIRSFAAHGMAQANLLAQMKHGGEISAALVGIKQETKTNPKALTPIYNQIAAKFRKTMTPRTGMLANAEDALMKFNSFYMLTSSLGYMAQNFTQPYFAVANIAEISGYSGQAAVWGKLFSGYGVAKKVINTGFLNQIKNVASMGLLGKHSTVELNIDAAPPELRPMLKQMQDRGLLDVGITEDLRSLASEAGNLGTRAYEEMTHRLYQSARYVEANNRIASAVAAFRTAQKNPAKMKKLGMTPQEYALRIVQDTQGNFSKLDAPALFDSLPKAPLQFRKYQFQMAFLHIDAAKQTFKGADAEMQMAGFRKLSLMLGYTGVFGGLASVPMAGVATSAVQAALSAFDPDDDDELNPDKSLERWIRENVDDERTATLLSRGLPAALGWDFSQKLDQADLFMPYNSKYVQMDPSRDGALLFAAQTLLGPTGTMVGNAGNIADFVERGNMYRAAEYAMPKGLRSYLETMRYSQEGYTTRSDLTIADPTSFDLVDILTNAVGLPSTDINQIKWTRGQQVEIEQWFSSESGRITRGYKNARTDKDRAAQAQYRDEFRELQRSKDRVRPFFNNSRRVLQRQSMSTLLKSPRRQASDQRRLDSITGR